MVGDSHHWNIWVQLLFGEQDGNQGETDTIPTPIVIIDQDSDPDATVVEITFGDRLGALLDTVIEATRSLFTFILDNMSITKTDYKLYCRWMRWKTWGWMLLRQMCFWILLASTTSFPSQKRKDRILEPIICLKGITGKKRVGFKLLISRIFISQVCYCCDW